MDVGEHTSGRDGDAAEELVELLVVLHGEGDVAGHDAGLLVVAGGVAGQLEDLSSEVLHDGGQVDGRSGSDSLGVVAFAEMSVDTSDGELESSPAGSGLRLSLRLSSFATARHDDEKGVE